jgi:phosphopantetheinyl transferase
MDTLLLIARYSDFDDPLISTLCRKLPSDRRSRAERAKNLAARYGLVLGYALLEYGTRKLLGQNQVPILSYGEHGKPYLQSRALAFSISHSQTAVAVLLSRDLPEIGIDLEEVRAIRPSLSKRFASDSELRDLRSERDAILLWTKKEAVAKASGNGLQGDLREINTEDTASVTLDIGGIQTVLSVAPADALPSDHELLFLSARDLI